MSLDSGQLLLALNTTLRCPKCAVEFSLDQGFAKKALDHLAEASFDAVALMREEERVNVGKRAQQMADEKARSSHKELESLKKLLIEQGAEHAAALAETRALAENAAAPRIAQLQQQLEQQNGQIQSLRAREDALVIRERDMDTQVSAAVQTRTSELMASERLLFEQQITEKSSQLAQLRDEQLLLRQERQQLKDEKAALTLEVQKQVDDQIQRRETVVRAQEQERSQLEKAELQKKLDDTSEQLASAQRRIEQGSQQLQGEVLELAIEDNLRRAFPLDSIEEVKKGQRGGDVLQHVTTRTGQAAGTMLWETKRAKDWSAQWIPKLKEDMRACNAAVGILVTMPETLPKDWPDSAYFALREGVWVTQASCAVGVAEVLRSGMLDLHRQRQASEGKSEKMEALYDYLTSPQFAQKLAAVFETFKRMRDELESERNQTTQRWARREKQLQVGTTQLLGIGGEIQGLSQQALPVLELEAPPSGDDE